MVNDGNDSSDSEGEAEVYTSDDDGELSFESDEEGNFTRNLNKMKLNGGDVDEEDDDEDEGSSEDDDVYVSDTDEGSDGEGEILTKNSDTDEESNAEEETDAPQEEAPKIIKNKKKQKPTSVEAFKTELNGSSSKSKPEEDEYKDDTSDEEDIRNTIGNIPMHWYDEYKHIGYDWDAKKIIKPARRDQLDDFLKRMEDPNFWRTVKDMQTGQDIVISEADIELIKRINSQRIPDDQYEEYAVSYL